MEDRSHPQREALAQTDSNTRRAVASLVRSSIPGPHLVRRNLIPNSFLDMLTEITELSLGQPATYRSLADDESEAESLDGWDDEVGRSSLVVSPANIPAYDCCHAKGNDLIDWESDRVLVEWFAGWAAQNAQRHRKFPAVSGVASLLNQESNRWGHVRCSGINLASEKVDVDHAQIEVVDPNKYMIQNKISF
jgi:hypothetical protein